MSHLSEACPHYRGGEEEGVNYCGGDGEEGEGGGVEGDQDQG